MMHSLHLHRILLSFRCNVSALMTSMQEPIRLELPEIFNMKTVNSWLFKYPEPTLIDCGELTEASYQGLAAGLAAHGLLVSDIQRIIITHAHVDHMGMANRIAEESGAKVWVSEYAADWATHVNDRWPARTALIKQTLERRLMSESPIAQMLQAGSAAFQDMLTYWEPIPPEHVHIFQSGNGIEIGGARWEVIYAPGHSSTQTCFYQPQSRYLLSADMLLNIAPTPVIEADPFLPDIRMRGLSVMMQSYQTFRTMDISTVFPGHYQPFQNAEEVIDRQVARIRQRAGQCLELIRSGITDYSTLLLQMYPKRMSFPAIAMMIGYLDLLEANGQIVSELIDGIYHYKVLH